MLPTPEEERAVLWAIFIALGLSVFGAMVLMVATAFVLAKISQWVFG